MKPGKGVVKDSQHIDPGESDGHLRWAVKVTWPMLLSAFRQVQPNDSIFVLLLSQLYQKTLCRCNQRTLVSGLSCSESDTDTPYRYLYYLR
jgi:hypothetical protein